MPHHHFPGVQIAFCTFCTFWDNFEHFARCGTILHILHIVGQFCTPRDTDNAYLPLKSGCPIHRKLVKQSPLIWMRMETYYNLSLFWGQNHLHPSCRWKSWVWGGWGYKLCIWSGCIQEWFIRFTELNNSTSLLMTNLLGIAHPKYYKVACSFSYGTVVFVFVFVFLSLSLSWSLYMCFLSLSAHLCWSPTIWEWRILLGIKWLAPFQMAQLDLTIRAVKTKWHPWWDILYWIKCWCKIFCVWFYFWKYNTLYGRSGRQ